MVESTLRKIHVCANLHFRVSSLWFREIGKRRQPPNPSRGQGSPFVANDLVSAKPQNSIATVMMHLRNQPEYTRLYFRFLRLALNLQSHALRTGTERDQRFDTVLYLPLVGEQEVITPRATLQGKAKAGATLYCAPGCRCSLQSKVPCVSTRYLIDLYLSRTLRRQTLYRARFSQSTSTSLRYSTLRTAVDVRDTGQ